MNREGNTYTFIYASVMVILVAAVLSFAATNLKPLQDKNIEIATKMDILKSVKEASDRSNAETKYDQIIKDTYVLNSKGQKVDGDAFTVNMGKEVLKPHAERALPVYVATLKDGSVKYIIPVYGKGLWGPIWGYVSLNEDKSTIFGVTYAHKGETPGLGAEIAGKKFQDQFINKKVVNNGSVEFGVLKSIDTSNNPYAVDAITGGTITSNGLSDMLNDCLSAYQPFLTK